MEKHEEKYCPKCNNVFVCKMGDIANCQCSQINISNEVKSFLSNTDFDCLCKDCLTHFNQLVKISKQHHFPTQKEMLIEGLHFYKDNGNWVFSELYHLLRGYCCRKSCRHCVYGFRAKVL